MRIELGLFHSELHLSLYKVHIQWMIGLMLRYL